VTCGKLLLNAGCPSSFPYLNFLAAQRHKPRHAHTNRDAPTQTKRNSYDFPHLPGPYHYLSNVNKDLHSYPLVITHGKMTKQPSPSLTSSRSIFSTLELPPVVGMIGSILFFVALFSLSNPNAEGYAQFRKCHGNCVNGVLHAIGMPLAVSGVFMVVRSVSDSPSFTRQVQICVTSAYLYLYQQYEPHPYSPILFYILYLGIFELILYQQVYRNHGRLWHLTWGLLLIFANVGALEAIGHGQLYEKHHSYVSEFFNSVFHTPLYGINSLLGLIWERPEHTCW
jgi:hypothetical protein